MRRLLRRLFQGKKGAWHDEILPEDIFIDSSNLPNFDVHQFEGRLEKPIAKQTYYIFIVVLVLVAGLFVSKLWLLQVTKGEAYAIQSERNRLSQGIIFSERGIIEDRNGTLLAWNTPPATSNDISKRKYIGMPGFSHLLGYVTYPTKDSNGFFYSTETKGKAGLEKSMDGALQGENGRQIVETDALGNLVSQSVIEPPVHGKDLVLSIDAPLQEQLYSSILALIKDKGFTGGAGVFMDIHTGELLAMTSVPEYNSNIMAEATDTQRISTYINSSFYPFLDRVVSGLYTPGSIMKPFIAMGALTYNIITPEKKILSTGTLSLPNPFVPGTFSVFKDWKAHGWVNMKEAIAVSSDIYFYEVGGGFEDQPGLGIDRIHEFVSLFGFGSKTGINIPGEVDGLVPSQQWKTDTMHDDWRIGDTYHAAIGQSAFQVTPIQAVRAFAALANGGDLIEPSFILGQSGVKEHVDVVPAYEQIVREGMLLATQPGNTVQALYLPYLKMGAKSGTAELGVNKDHVNSWVVGFFPYDKPKYAFAIVMEHGPVSNLVGASYIGRQIFEWMHENEPQYLSVDND
jgi:penicillin-binding protein 2